MNVVPGNRITLLECGAEYFPALVAALDAAQAEVHLETYIFARDASGCCVAEALCRAAARGVTVRVMVDGFGGRDFVQETLPELVAAGVEVLIYRREIAGWPRMRNLRRHRLRRLHRKLAVIDGKVAFVGGINIIDDLNTPQNVPPRFDYAVRVEGPLLGAIHAAVTHLWWLVSWARLRVRPLPVSRVRPQTERVGAVRASFLVRDNLRHRREIEEAYLKAIAGAQKEIILACAYFFPGRRFRQALIDASRRGVRVVLLLQGRVEYALLHYASRALYPHLLEGGVHIHEYHRSFLHAKVAVVDDRWATVGSSNIDPFSLFLAREANVVVHDEGFTAQLHASLMRALRTSAREMQRDDWHRAPRLIRLTSWLAYGLVRLALGMLGLSR